MIWIIRLIRTRIGIALLRLVWRNRRRITAFVRR
jgi:hypothetical protein